MGETTSNIAEVGRLAKARGVTLEQVGRHAGVSRSTVSRVVNDLPGVRPEAKEAVLAAIEELGYVPNQTAKNLASRHAVAVTALIPEDMWKFFGDPFFAAVLSGIADEISHTDLVLNLTLAEEDTLNKTISYLAGGQADGILVLSHHTSHRLIEALESRMPIVYGGRPFEDSESSAYVDVDNVGAAAAAAEHLVQRGCKRVAMISGPLDMRSAVEREKGFVDALAPTGKLGPIVRGDYTAESGEAAARLLLEGGEEFDGLFVANDLMARAAMQVLRAAGKVIPDDVAVVGFDDAPIAAAANPPLTTVRQDSVDLGRWMARLLIGQLRGETEPRVVILPTELVIRESA